MLVNLEEMDSFLGLQQGPELKHYKEAYVSLALILNIDGRSNMQKKSEVRDDLS